MNKAIIVCAWLAALAIVSPARADEPRRTSPKDEAIARFKRGLELYQEGDLRSALSEFRKAHALAPMYRVHFNIGQVCFELKEYACALTSFEAFLKEGGDAIPSARRTAIQSDIAQLAPRVAKLVIKVAESGAEITVDDVVVGTSPMRAPLVVNAGRRKVSAQRPGGPLVTRVVDLAGAESMTVALSAPNAQTAHASGAQASAERRWTTISSIGVGVAGALTAGAVVTGVLARVTPDRASTLAITTGVLAGTAGATLGATLVGTFAKKPSGERTAGVGVRVGATPASIVVFGSF